MSHLKVALARKPLLKKMFDALWAPLYLVFYSLPLIRDHVAPFLRQLPRNLVYSPSGTGFGQDLEIRRLWRSGYVTGKDILLIGIERGDEVARCWLQYRPRRIVGVDLKEWPAEWARAAQSGQERGVAVAFHKMDAASLTFAQDSFDLVYSQAVLEHITNVEDFITSSRRVLKQDGVFYAMIGPLWHCYGGPHIAALAYDHLLLPLEEFLGKAASVGNGWEYWITRGLYNTHTFLEYLQAIERQFTVCRLGLVGSPEGRGYKTAHPEIWERLVNCAAEADLLINRVSITASKKNVMEFT